MVQTSLIHSGRRFSELKDGFGAKAWWMHAGGLAIVKNEEGLDPGVRRGDEAP
jgi:hypothetical protein